MSTTVDASISSEPTKSAPDPRVSAWLRTHERDIAVDPIILGESRRPTIVRGPQNLP
jgi:hypothetical protein